MVSAERGDPPFRVLFVCTGNTCRSPMAEALARRAVEARGWTGVEVASAGVATMDGLRASDGAMRVAADRGLDLSEHRTTRLTGRTIQSADLILTMSVGHLERVRELGGGERASLLTAFARGEEGDAGEGVPDPFGGSDEVYRETLDALTELVDAAVRRLETMVSP